MSAKKKQQNIYKDAADRMAEFQAAQNAAKSFLGDLPRDVKVGIVAFAGSAQVAQLPTVNREDLVTAIDRFQMQRATATGNAIVMSLATLFPEAGIDLSQFYQVFFEEAGENLEQMEQLLLDIDIASADDDAIAQGDEAAKATNDPEKIKLLRPGMNVDVDVHLK